MADRIYQNAKPVVAGAIDAKKGVLIVGGGTVGLKFYKPIDFNSNGSTLTGRGFQTAADEQATFTGTVQGTVVPVGVHTLVRTEAGTTVYKLA